ncbi:M15 family metallopeptidase [Myceligenerans xiligouense]|uniref:LAS superfamily LD-carboxypeptidase LdcB n=1 Tax=Myceligenerans xiligouense TaxID=253184 RepID=A0A3N4YKR4_9MICO|nr:M15 family metallopeptidase [Myceligenerans xiligouense]RPF19904.1 LAS superfamily LD-carboxypeptidase LdcB [Myceligenerans xiligouense]
MTVVLLMGAVTLLAGAAAYPLIERAAGPALLAAHDALDPSPRPSGSTGRTGGDIPGGLAAPDDDLPAVTRLDPALHAAVRQAAKDASAAGIDFWITSGWRSPAYQQKLYDDAVRNKGPAEARRTVADAETSQHVSGDAVDIGPTEGAYWLIQHGADYGLCQVYANEIWHFELLTRPGGTCPPMHDDAGG